MMTEEHGLVPIDRRHSRVAAFVVFIASLVGSALPVVPFVFLQPRTAAAGALALATAALFGIGAYKARTTTGNPWRAGAEVALIGMASALAGWGIGSLFGV
jgi:predicted membrane protein (TIGR00267 family)